MPFKDKSEALINGRKSYAKLMLDPAWREARAARAAAYMRNYYATNPAYRAKAHVQRETWRKANLGYNSFRQRLIAHGLTLDQYHAKLESQDFACAICADDDAKLMIDHNHGTGRRRGLLCGNCNWGIGMLQDSPDVLRNAAEYLQRWV